jgi:hypothetical protein
VRPSVEPILASPVLTEFSEKELRALERKGLSIHHLVLFLDMLRNNLHPEQLRKQMVPEEDGA